jgi:hypothetical protein
MIVVTASWLSRLPPDYVRIGISRGVPRRQAPGYKIMRALAPGPWFNSVSVAEYDARYREWLDQLDRDQVLARISAVAQGRPAALVCYEVAGKPGHWCHRSLCAQWLAEGLGRPVPEFGHEHLAQHLHPLLPVELRERG